MLRRSLSSLLFLLILFRRWSWRLLLLELLLHFLLDLFLDFCEDFLDLFFGLFFGLLLLSLRWLFLFFFFLDFFVRIGIHIGNTHRLLEKVSQLVNVHVLSSDIELADACGFDWPLAFFLELEGNLVLLHCLGRFVG